MSIGDLNEWDVASVDLADAAKGVYTALGSPAELAAVKVSPQSRDAGGAFVVYEA